jgi:hypothetical protein
MLVSNWHTLCVLKPERDKKISISQVESKQDERVGSGKRPHNDRQKFAVTNFFNGDTKKEDFMGTILLIILILLLIGALPSWPYSTGWGYYPSGGIGLILLILIILLVMGRI